MIALPLNQKLLFLSGLCGVRRERQLNALLIEHGINRIPFDTRALFKNPVNDDDTLEALKAKPNLPLHVIATGQNPMVRFINAKDWQGTLHYLKP